MQLIVVTGAQKSGKSRYAEARALAMSDRPAYLATSRVWDDDFAERIARHKSSRDARWVNLEHDVDLAAHGFDGEVIVLDCITLWLTNLFTDCGYDRDATLAEAKERWQQLDSLTPQTVIAVGNEIGWSLHAETQMGRHFVDLHGSFMQYIAAQANEVVLMVAGLPLKVK
ncbi:bifunctional adenosylcobinamide kinase/adenosylcobinamide-phosphate guanylyltransferase [Chitinibacter bivalviorum]|uniref:Bifunctional adenosylcobalamin biosynthesis protein n=1 Tax=Chitinibacter bivalviorum TaxID=2739434 RepID=A0A7H9BJQ2_9NEIS|nr:bifunctional adenosylcobinamide kinase/adenosylcobinamide-phosphate guanylyltransferase [Chitinibacter bivalviorum]QLG88478.1 bifunctional adenosylcobinamide kinase/adenosylcobinamide-phosphate guanylyltransferase [Chitinibacter bivalviorum]